jgi:hypothetical protein
MTPITIEEFEVRVLDFDWKGEVTAFHLHHTADPIATWKGAASVQAIRNYHVKTRGYRDFAQHVTLGPDGTIWLGRDWNLAPASATGHNGYDFQKRPFMIETFGDFRTDELRGAQRDNLIRIIAAVQDRFDLPPDALKFHREMQATECPGKLDKAEIVAEVAAYRGAA